MMLKYLYKGVCSLHWKHSYYGEVNTQMRIQDVKKDIHDIFNSKDDSAYGTIHISKSEEFKY